MNSEAARVRCLQLIYDHTTTTLNHATHITLAQTLITPPHDWHPTRMVRAGASLRNKQGEPDSGVQLAGGLCWSPGPPSQPG